MKRRKTIVIFFLLIFPAFLFSQDSDTFEELTVARAAICKDVKDREPVDSDTVFPSDIVKVFCFTKIDGASSPTQIFHVWKYNDKEMARVELDVKSVSWRTWSSKRIIPSWTGHWTVEIQNERGDVLKMLEFEIK